MDEGLAFGCAGEKELLVRRSIRKMILLAFLGAALPAAAQDGWVFQASLGAVANLETPLTIRQSGFEEIETGGAEYETRPFESPVYYSLRAGRWRGGVGWELELIHHKIYLQDPPPEVQHFAISHGYNMVTVNRAWERGGFVWRAGLGPVVAHPENQIRGRVLRDAGYELTGPVVQAGVERRFVLGERWFVSLEGKATAARAEVSVADGEAEVPNAALHGLLGIGYRWRR